MINTTAAATSATATNQSLHTTTSWYFYRNVNNTVESVFVFFIGNLWTMSHSPSLSLSLSLSALSDSVKACGAEALALLGQMKQQDSIATADSSKLKAVLEAIRATAEVSASLKFAYRQNGSH